MSHTHSPEPWRICGEVRGGCTCGQIWSIPLDMHVCTIVKEPEGFEALTEQQIKSNARRITACVNACAGVTTENLERNRIGENIIKAERQRDELQQQSDTLLAALKETTQPLELYNAYGWPDSMKVIRTVKNAIASIESPTQEQ